MSGTFDELTAGMQTALRPGESVEYAGRYPIATPNAVFADTMRQGAIVVVTPIRLIIEAEGVWGSIERTGLVGVEVDGSGRASSLVVQLSPGAVVDQLLAMALSTDRGVIEVGQAISGDHAALVQALGLAPPVASSATSNASPTVQLPAVSPVPQPGVAATPPPPATSQIAPFVPPVSGSLATAPTLAPLPPGMSGSRSATGGGRSWLGLGVIGGAAFVVLVIAAVTLLGKSPSAKFSSVGLAVDGPSSSTSSSAPGLKATTETSASSVRGESTTTTMARTTTTVLSTTTTANPHILASSVSATSQPDVEAVDSFYSAVVRSDWDFARAHFINAEKEGPDKDNAWWASQYGSIKEFWLVPTRTNGSTIWIGLLTHESDPNGGPYTYEFCIPLTVSGTFVRQAGPAPSESVRRTNGYWLDPAGEVDRLQSC